MNGYENGKIYKLVDKNDNIIYIGSTKQNLKERWRKHHLNCDENKIILIENYPCECKRELEKYEQKFIDLYSEMGLINQRKAYCSEEERKQNEKDYKKTDKMKEYNKKYKKTDKYKESLKKYYETDKYKEYRKLKANCPFCYKLMLKRCISEHTKLYCKEKKNDND